MPFANQFSLSLELTRLIPILSTTPQIQSLIKLARGLQSSGSDIVVEEDLTAIFGRSRIDPQLASSFRSAVAKTASTKLCEGVTLESGPGPTVTRAFSQHHVPYFSMVVQCSMLCAAFEKESLAAAIHILFEQQTDGTLPVHATESIPNEAGIRGALQACEEQTSAYDWRLYFLAVANAVGTTLGSPLDFAPQIPENILRGLASMLPLVQHLPDDRLIHIQLPSNEGFAFIVVWAHYVLGLNVVVSIWSGATVERTTFGTGEANVVVDVAAQNGTNSAICLMSSPADGEQEELLKLVPDSDTLRIQSIQRERVRGYGTYILRTLAADVYPDEKGVVEEMVYIVCSFALLISTSLVRQPQSSLHGDEAHDGTTLNNYDGMLYEEAQREEELYEENFRAHLTDGDDDYENAEDEDQISNLVDLPSKITEQRIFEVCQIIFESTKLRSNAIVSDYRLKYLHKPLDQHHLAVPDRIRILYNQAEQRQTTALGLARFWEQMIEAAKYLAVIVISLAHTSDLESCSELPLIVQLRSLHTHPLVERLRTWNGEDSLAIGEFSWYHAITLLLTGRELNNPIGKSPPALVSDHGWSVYLSTFDPQYISEMIDPSLIPASGFAASQGVPWRNGVQRHAIVDGPDKGTLGDYEYQDHAGDIAMMRCAKEVSQGRPIYGERQDCFLITLRLITSPNDNRFTRRTGYAELFSALWCAQLTSSCSHICTKIELQPGCKTLSGFGDSWTRLDETRVAICLTAGKSAARWRALIAIARACNGRWNNTRVLLRTNDCCFQCAIDRTAADNYQWFVVL